MMHMFTSNLLNGEFGALGANEVQRDVQVCVHLRFYPGEFEAAVCKPHKNCTRKT